MADDGLFTDSDRAKVERQVGKLRQAEGQLLNAQALAGALARDLGALRAELEGVLNRNEEEQHGGDPGG